MAKEKAEPDAPDDIPAWFMTYSDVITLLMTFFILLLTFATTEPERFDKIQVSLFGGAGATGIAGDPPEGMEKDSWVSRTRPPSARMCLKGSEMPPTHSNPSLQSPTKEIAGLADDKFNDLVDQYAIELNINELVASDGEIFPLGKLQGVMLAKKMFRLPMMVTFEVSTDQNVERAVHFAHHIFTTHQIKPGQMGVSRVNGLSSNQMRIVIEHHLVN